MNKRNFLMKLIPFLVFLFFTFIACVAWNTFRQSLIKDTKQHLDNKTQKVASIVNEKVKAYVDSIYGARGLFSASLSVERNEWRSYIQGIDLPTRHPGISSMTFVARVKTEDKAGFIKAMQEDKSTNGVGYPDFKINPDADKAEYYVGKYIEPEVGRVQLLGFDMSSDPARNKALVTARDSNAPAATAVVSLVTTNKPGMSIALPIYQNGKTVTTTIARKENLVGFILAALRADDFFNSVVVNLEKESAASIIFDVYDIGDDGQTSLFFSYNPGENILFGHSFSETNLQIADRTWLLRAYDDNVGILTRSDEFLAFSILFGGILLSFFIALTFYFLINSRRRALVLSEQMIDKALQDKKRFGILFQSSNDAIMTLEPPDWKFTSGNAATFKLFKVKDEKEFVALGPWELSPDKQPDGQLSSEKSKKMINKAMEDGSAFFDWTHRKYRGDNFAATVLLAKVKYGDKEFLQATVRDVSEQKKSEELEKARIDEIERMNELMIGRELKMVELKEDINKLKRSKK